MAKRSVRDVFRRMLLALRHNWGLKLLSLFFAMLLWNYVIVVVDPGRTVTSKDVTVGQPIGLAQLENNDLTVRGDIASYLKNASVDVVVHRSDEAQLKQSGGVRVWASVDLSGITQEGVQSVKVSYTSSVGVVKAYAPDTISVTVEKLEKRAVPIVFEATGSLPSGYWMGAAAVTPQVLQISGAVSDVDKVEKAVAQVSLDGLTTDYNAACNFVLVDKDGATVSLSGLAADPPNCIVSFPVMPTKLVPIDASNGLNGSPAKGYSVNGVPVLSPAAITIAAPADVLTKIDSLPLESVDISGATGNVTKISSVQLPQGVQAVDANSVAVTVNIAPRIVTRTIKDVPIEFTGLADNLKPDKPYTGSITYSCPELSAPDLLASSFHLVADAADKGAGTQQLSLTASYDDAEAGVTDLAPDPAQVTVKFVASTP